MATDGWINWDDNRRTDRDKIYVKITVTASYVADTSMGTSWRNFVYNNEI